MNKCHFGSLFIAAYILSSPSMVFGQHDSFEKELEEQREKEYHGRETIEEKDYYRRVSPRNIPDGKNYLKTDHPLEQAPLPDNRIPNNKIPDNKIPANKLPSDPI
jgi:hypothetical protein